MSKGQEEGPAYKHVAHQAFLKSGLTKISDLIERISFFWPTPLPGFQCTQSQASVSVCVCVGGGITFPLKHSSQSVAPQVSLLSIS